MFAAVITFKTIIGGLFLFWFLSVVMMSQKTMANNKMGIREALMLWMKALFVVLIVMVMLVMDFK